MEPKNVAPTFESIPQPGQSFEVPSIATPEQLGESSHEVVNQAPARVEQQTIAPPIVLPSLPQIASDSPLVQDDSNATSSNPLIASDDDLIEKEWVDKAKQIIAETRDDPFRREAEIGRLQIDYVKKRYGRQIGSVKD